MCAERMNQWMSLLRPWLLPNLLHYMCKTRTPSLSVPHSSLHITAVPLHWVKESNVENVVGNLWVQIPALPLTHCLTWATSSVSLSFNIQGRCSDPQLRESLEAKPFTNAQGAALQLALAAAAGSMPGDGCGSFLTKCTSSGL